MSIMKIYAEIERYRARYEDYIHDSAVFEMPESAMLRWAAIYANELYRRAKLREENKAKEETV